MSGTARTIAYFATQFTPVGSGGSVKNAQQFEDLTATLARRTPILNVMWPEYGAVGDFTTDDKAAIQAAIDACNTAGGGFVFCPRPTVAYGILTSLTLKPGVMLIGEAASPGYFDGWDGYSGTANTGSTNRIKAQAGFSGSSPLIALDVTDTTNAARGKGYGIRDLILDGNGVVQYVVSGLGATFIERFVTLDNVTIMHSASSGIVASNIMFRMSRCNIFANSLYGWELTCTDSIFENNYVHSNASGGIVFDSGSTHNTIVGGKIEENFGYGAEIFAGGANQTQVNFVNVDFQHNTSSAVKADGGTSGFSIASLTGCVLTDNGYAKSSGNPDGAQLLADASGRILAFGNLFMLDHATPYHLAATNSGKLRHWNSVFRNVGSVANTFTATSGTITADPGSITTIA